MYPFQRKFLAFVQFSLLYFLTITAYPDGNVEISCDTMDPSVGHGGAPSNDPCIYETVTDVVTLAVGGSLTVTLRNLTTTSYKGFMTMAFDASKPDDAGPIGTFGVPSNGQTLNCTDGTNNAISHKDSLSKKSTTAVWTAPIDFAGTVVFKTTFVRGLTSYWVKEPSINVIVGTPEETTLTLKSTETTVTLSTMPTVNSTPEETTTTPKPTETTVTLSTMPTCSSTNLVSCHWIIGFFISCLAYTIHF